MMKQVTFLFFLVTTISSCEQTKITPTELQKHEQIIPIQKNDNSISWVENRDSIITKLIAKIEDQTPLVVHVMVPLCDNDHQGIIPTTPSLGNGLDLHRNLYWATSKGMKRYFKEHPDWNFLVSQLDPTDDILERVVFKKSYNNGAIVYLVADAYRGDRMVNTLNDFFNSLAGALNDSISIDGKVLGIHGNADLLAFNGHNGLMDENTSHKLSVDGKQRDAVAIACSSGPYFREEYLKTNSYPLVTTTNLLYPGAFILEAIINEWAQLKNDQECKIAAGDAYYKNKPKSGPNGSQNLFDYGW